MKTNSKKSEKEKKEFIIALVIVGVLVLAFILSFFLPDLIKEWKYKLSLVSFTQTETHVTDENGNKYYVLNRSVEAISTDGVYGLLEDKEYRFIGFMHEKDQTPLYIVEHERDMKGMVLRLETAEEITISNFSPISADICFATSDYPYDYLVAADKYLENGGNNKNDEEYINLIFDALVDGKEVPSPMTQESASRIKLKSQKYPGLYYTVMFITDKNGISYLQDVGSGKCVLSPDKLTVRMS
ncbi:MAG: hypothetical protein E7614_01775 [Ruminococcaceae bacterium]|nr:hypothetical protein [Oscillospiraceae bacterium]